VSSHANKPRSLNILTALACEAKPLIDTYRLTKVQSRPYAWFSGCFSKTENTHINLVVSGIGELNIATACGWLAANTQNSNCAWLNIGIAGHAVFGVGDIVRVHQSLGVTSTSAVYPPMVAKWPGKTSALLSYNAPCAEYPENALADMEGAAFFPAAGQFSSLELVQSLKIVSDNQTHSMDRLNATLISELVQARVSEIDQFGKSLIDLIPIELEQHDTLPLIDHLHCTVSQRQQYLVLTDKLRVVGQFGDAQRSAIRETQSMKVLLNELETQLATAQPTLVAI